MVVGRCRDPYDSAGFKPVAQVVKCYEFLLCHGESPRQRVYRLARLNDMVCRAVERCCAVERLLIIVPLALHLMRRRVADLRLADHQLVADRQCRGVDIWVVLDYGLHG